jgi:chemotaxis protein MotB
MAAQKNAKAPEPAGESAPMWIVSFADLVTLLMSFFVVLYALKQGGEKQQMEVAAAIKATFDSSIPPLDSPNEFEQAIRRAKGLPGPPYQNTGGKAKDPNAGAQGPNPQVTRIRPGRAIVTGGKITFEINQSQLDEECLATIQKLADQVKGLNNVLMVKGHASVDELPLRPDDPTGRDLSYQRAMAVVNELVRLGIDPKVLRPVSCGAFEPIKTGVYDAAGLRQNRRVEVFTTENTVGEFFPINTVPANTAPAHEQGVAATSKK